MNKPSGGLGQDQFRIKTDLEGEAFNNRKKLLMHYFSNKVESLKEDGGSIYFNFEHQAYEGAPGIEIKAKIVPEYITPHGTFIVTLERNGPGMTLHSYCQQHHRGKSIKKVFRNDFESLLKQKAKRHGSKQDTTKVEEGEAVIGTA